MATPTSVSADAAPTTPANDNAPMRSWAPEVLCSGTWTPNGVRFATEAEAEQWGRDLLMRWFVPTDSRAVQSTDVVNYAYTDDGLVAVAS